MVANVGVPKGKSVGGPFVYQDATIDYVLAVVASQLAEGVGSVTLTPPLQLNRNTIVRKYDLKVAAAHAPRTQAQNVAQVRAYSASGVHTVVIDFGTPRTVSYVDVPSGTKILRVSAWAGAQFGLPFFPSAYGADGTQSYAAFPSEVRAERLLLKLDKALSTDTVGQDITLEIPDLPADLELRINDATPVWTNPGAVQPATGVVAPVVDRWSESSERIVPLADALNALAADPLADEVVPFNLVLTSKVPGTLALTADPAPVYSHIHRVKFGAETSLDVEFTGEGYEAILLEIPAAPAGKTHRIEEVRLSVLAKLPPERVLPPLGPDWVAAPLGADALVLAELALDPAHAACVRLGASGLAELSGVRLPLTASSDGAEVRVTLWSADPVSGEPVEPVPNGASAPVTLAGGETPDTWTTLAFSKPVPLDKTPLPWVAVVVSRGAVTWSLAKKPAVVGAVGSDTALADASRLRRGAPNGPWHALPLPFQSSVPPSVMDARGRIRAIGHGAKTAPVAPLLLGLAGQDSPVAEVTPTAKGVPVALTFDPPAPVTAANPTLSIVSRVAGTLTLRDIDVVWHDA
jgi:hypothetical protein